MFYYKCAICHHVWVCNSFWCIASHLSCLRLFTCFCYSVSPCNSCNKEHFELWTLNLPIPQIQLFQNLTFKNQSQGHGWGQSSKSQNGFDFLSTRSPFVPCQLALPFLRCDFLKFDLENRKRPRSKLKVIDSHPFCSMSIDPSIPEIQLFQNLTLKIQGQGHERGQSPKPQSVSHFLSIHIILFHVNQPSHSWNTAFTKFDLEKSRSSSWDKPKFKTIKGVPLPIDSHPLSFRVHRTSHSFDAFYFQHLTLKIQGEGHKPMMLHNYRFS